MMEMKTALVIALLSAVAHGTPYGNRPSAGLQFGQPGNSFPGRPSFMQPIIANCTAICVSASLCQSQQEANPGSGQRSTTCRECLRRCIRDARRRLFRGRRPNPPGFGQNGGLAGDPKPFGNIDQSGITPRGLGSQNIKNPFRKQVIVFGNDNLQPTAINKALLQRGMM